MLESYKVKERLSLVCGLVSMLLTQVPTGNLDHDSGIEIMNFLKDLNEEGMTIVMVTHDSNVAVYSKRKLKMLDGKINNSNI